MLTEKDLPSDRARRHAALGEPHRLRIVDALQHSDRTPTELQHLAGLSSNLLAHHLDVLAEAGLVTRRSSEGDGRRRYVTLCWQALDELVGVPPPPEGPVVFVCTRNAARSQLAAALWRARTGGDAVSAGTEPAPAPDRFALDVAAGHGLDTSGWRSRGYDELEVEPAMVVSVCDRAREAGLPWTAPHLHWSVTDPASGRLEDYERAFRDIEARVERLVTAREDVTA